MKWWKSVIAIVVLYPLGFGEPIEPTQRWWTERIIWIVAPSAILSVFLIERLTCYKSFRFQHLSLPPP